MFLKLIHAYFFWPYIAFIVFAVVERLFSTFYRTKAKPRKRIYLKSSFFILLIGYLSIVIASITEYFVKGQGVLVVVSIAGFLLYLSGVVLRRRAIKDLAGNWSVFIEIKENHKLITRGIYKHFKHPYCLAVVFELSGFCLVANSYGSLLFVFLVQLPLVFVRIILEEKVLVSHFGETYKSYIMGKYM